METEGAKKVLNDSPAGEAKESGKTRGEATARGRGEGAAGKKDGARSAAKKGVATVERPRPGYVRVILRKKIEKLGDIGQIIEVRSGYARNYLLPMGLAYEAGPDAEKRVENEKRRLALKEQKRAQELAELAGKLDGISINVSARADGENLYGSVGPKDIAAAILAEHKVEIPESAVALEEHIKKIGVYDVALKLAPGAETKIKVWVVAAE